MKGYARKNKRMQLNVKYRWRGMAKSNTRKHNKRMKFEVVEYNDSLKERYGTTLNPQDAPQWCNLS